MGRVLLATFHLILATLLGLSGAYALLLARTWWIWEQGFFGRERVELVAFGAGGVLLVAIALTEAITSIAYAVGRRWGLWGLALTSGLLLAMLPGPLAFGVLLGMFVLGLQLWRERLEALYGSSGDDA